MELEEFITATQAAEVTGYHPSQIRRLCQAGDLIGAVKVGKHWMIPRASVERYAPGPRGLAGTEIAFQRRIRAAIAAQQEKR